MRSLLDNYSPHHIWWPFHQSCIIGFPILIVKGFSIFKWIKIHSTFLCGNCVRATLEYEIQTFLKLENYGFGFLPISLSSLSLTMVLVIIPRFNHCSSYHIPPSTIAPTKRSHSKRSRYHCGCWFTLAKPNEQIELIIGLNIFNTLHLM